MSTDDAFDRLGAALFGKTRRAVLALLFGHPERAFYLREILRMLESGQGAVQRDLVRLTAAGLLARRRQGNQVYYQANPDSPIFTELKSLALKTSGMADVLRAALAGLATRITVAFVHGSMARGDGRSGSDVDVVAVGHATFAEVLVALQPAQEKLQREVNATVYSAMEFRRKLAEGHYFLTTVMDKPKLFLIGGRDELARLGAQRLAHGA